ncbi:MAG TPA: septum formation initiator family protein [Candidatus Magasanikbacteria bacterium]|nr:septum formation initiator family protein [Candidatus Magasanikbacteria bacterium]
MQNEGKKFKKVFYSYWFLFVMLGIFTVVSVAFTRSFYQDYQVKKEIERLKKEFSVLETKKLRSLELLSYFQSDEFLEKRARLEMNLSKPGEQVAVIKGLNEETDGQTENNVIKSNLPNYKKWWNYFFNHN